jgi:hypothetical protein
MRRIYMVGFLALCVSVPFAYGLSSSAATGPATIRITSREVSRVRMPVGAPGRIGDTEIVRQNIFNRRIKPAPIGQAEYLCTFLTSRMRSCNVTITLPQGRIVAGGTFGYLELYELAILGGTRLYDNARGTLTVIQTTTKPRRQILVFRLAG